MDLISSFTLCFVAIAIVLLSVITSSLKQINQYQRGVLFIFGKFSKVLGPGWHFIVPIISKLVMVDIRLIAVEVEGQETMTKDNVSVHINAVIYYRVIDPAKAVIEVQNIDWAVNQLAQTTMRNVIGSFVLDEVLSQRKTISEQIEKIVEHTSTKWGVHIENLDIKDVQLPEGLKRTMAKVAEADREKRAAIIMSEGEVVAASNLSKAASILSSAPGALHLRTLSSINDLSSDESNTVIFMVPVEALRALEGFNKLLDLKIRRGEGVNKDQKKQ
jgi:regulator of protease activity HflC (stomatin/prohibitin superfamily)